jgi:hypothetical protein
MTNTSSVWRQIAGWAAVAASTGFACMWAWWGSIENFHEGWYHQTIWRNIGLMLVQYLSPMLIVIVVSAVAFCWPRLALPLMGASAIAAAWYFGRFRISSAAVLLIAIPLVLLGVLYHFGRPQPRKWAWRCLIGLPLVTAVASGAYPGWMAVHRFDDGNYGMRLVEGNGVILVWAPEGPGWPDSGVTWQSAMQNCADLTLDGHSLAGSPQNVWRLPTVDEAVRSLVFRGANSGGMWEPNFHRAQYRITPDKDSPLWKVHSQVIYWWTSTEAGRDRAYYITNNGYVQVVPKRIRPDYLAFRCVTEPAKVSLLQVDHR